MQRSIETVKVMFQRRGYKDVTQIIPFKLGKLQTLSVTAQYENPRSGTIENIVCVWFPQSSSSSPSSIGKSSILQLCTRMSKQDHLILIVDTVTFHGTEYLNENEFYWEHLTYQEVSFDIMSHVKVPHYSLLPSEEVTEIEKKYGSKKLFPKMISGKDAVARFMDYRVGDLVKITSRSATAGNYVTYRLLIAESDLL